MGSDSAIKIRRVTVAGVTGAIGPGIVEALCAAKFQVQALTRQQHPPTTTPPLAESCALIRVDYSNKARLAEILTGQDAVISTLGDTAGAVKAQETLIYASLAAGVKRFIPSEFGSDTMNERVRSFPFFADKLRHQEVLKKAAAEDESFTYSIIITGPFLDWGLSVVPFIINVGTRSAEVFNGGNVPFSATRVATLGKAVVATLERFEATSNRSLYIHDAIVTQRELMACEERISGNLPFTHIPVDTQSLEEEAWRLFRDPASDPLSWVFPFINISIWSRERLCAFKHTDNELLGIPVLRGPELGAVLDHEIEKAIRSFSTDHTLGSPASRCRAAEKAFEDGKRRLVGWRRTLPE